VLELARTFSRFSKMSRGSNLIGARWFTMTQMHHRICYFLCHFCVKASFKFFVEG